MKKIVIGLSLLLSAMCVLATQRSVEDAAALAQDFVLAEARTAPRGTMATKVSLAHTVLQPTVKQPAAYVFSRGTDAGYVIVAAEDNVCSILGYADDGDFDAETMPEPMRFWLDKLAEQIAYAQGVTQEPMTSLYPFEQTTATIQRSPAMPNKTLSIQTPVAPRAAVVARSLKEDSVVAPLLGNTKWDQGKPYYNFCPADPSNRNALCYTGCVATAFAQVMRAWRYPEQGTGSNRYWWQNGKQTLSQSFTATYDWDNMLDTYSNWGGYSTAQADAVAQLMYDVGVACKMNYGGDKAGGSGAYGHDAAIAMVKNFGYDQCIRPLWMDYMGVKAFEEAVANEIRARRPVVLSGATDMNEGHCFVCDGIDEKGLFHINWGWSGSQNGYFVLTALDPQEQGIGGAASGHGYKYNVLAFDYMFPDNGNEKSYVWGAKDGYWSAGSVRVGENVSFTFTELWNLGLWDWRGTFCLGLFDTEGNFVGQIDEDATGLSVPSLQGWDKIPWSGKFPQLEDGTYSLHLIYSVGEKWLTAFCPYDFSCVVSGDIVTLLKTNPYAIPDSEFTPKDLKSIVTPGQITLSWEPGEATAWIVYVWNLTDGSQGVFDTTEPYLSLSNEDGSVADYGWKVMPLVDGVPEPRCEAYGPTFTTQAPLYTIKVVANDRQMGTVAIYQDGKKIGTSGTFASGTKIVIEATPYAEDGYDFDHWQDNKYSNPRTITVKKDMTYTAYFISLREGLEETEMQNPTVCYDLFGRVVDCESSSGLLIQVDGVQTKKILK